MSNIKKLMMSAAGGEALNVEDVFSTYLYTGNSASQPINNGVDLAGEGGMVWLKARTAAYNNIIVDSERGSSNGTAFNLLFTNLTNAQNTAASYGVTSFDNDGFTLGPSGQQPISNQGGASYADLDYASWTFRKAPKFFDVVTYTGTGSPQTIAHNLGSVPGCIIVKQTNGTRDWPVYHRGIDATNPSHYKIPLNKTEARANENRIWNDTEPTSTHFTVGDDGETGGDGNTYVAYLFAHNDGDGGFGPDGDADIIKCGSYTGNGSFSAGPEIDLGFEPQWVMIKNVTTGSTDWLMLDSMRGIVTSGNELRLFANRNYDESSTNRIELTPTGFKITAADTDINEDSNNDYIYVAIRRGPMAVPESGTDVFAMDVSDGSGPPYFTSGFPVDFAFRRRTNTGEAWETSARPMGDRYIVLNSFVDQETDSQVQWDYQNGWFGIIASNTQSWMWKRAPGFLDTVTYIADGVQGSAFNHNLGVVPEMMWIKKLTGNQNWYVYHKDIGNDKYLSLNNNLVPTSNTLYLDSTTPDDTTFTVGNVANNNSQTYINTLFATVPGVSKVGSYTGNGSSSRTIDCGFSNGARFFFIKDTTQAGSWWTFDTERGLGFYMDLSSADTTSSAASLVSANSSGFALASSGLNVSNNTYIFYAVA